VGGMVGGLVRGRHLSCEGSGGTVGWELAGLARDISDG